MANSASDNVVALGDHARARGRAGRAEFADALSACRGLALERMGEALARMLDRIEDELFELAEAARDREQQNTYLDARAQARAKRGAMEAAFRAHFVDLFDRKVMAGEEPAHPAPPAELALVEAEDLEESLAVREMARKLGSACETELFALRQRMGLLLQQPDLGDDANPVSPETICAALKDACDQIESGFKVRMAVLRQMERHAEGALNAIYHELNAQLIERRILPEVRHEVRRAAPVARAPVAAREAATSQPAESRPDVFAALSQWLSSTPSGGDGPTHGLVAGPRSGTATSAATPAQAAPDPGLLAHLTRLHRESGSAHGGTPEDWADALKALKSSTFAASLGSVDAMTIDVVGMLFDYIFEDRHIPAEAKAQLARLQLPTLKVALLDKAFFSSAEHPARRLIDLLAECAIGLDESHARESGVLALVESVVGTVLSDFETDLALFATQAARVEAFMEERREAERLLVERSARLLEERERREAALLAARVEIERRVEARAWLPQAVRDVLAGPWAASMAEAAMQQGVEGAMWQDDLRAMEDLLWSVEPKVAPEDRRRLVTTLPALLARIGAVLQRAGVPAAERDAFFGALVDCHAHAVKAGLRGIAALPPVEPPREVPAGLEREVVPAGDLELEEIRLRPARGAVRNVFTRTGIWTNLQRGTWVEFARPEGPRIRARLTWISPNKGVYLFTNPLTHKAAVSISPEALAEQMRMGEARMLDDGPLVDRAVGSMMASLEARAKPLPAQG